MAFLWLARLVRPLRRAVLPLLALLAPPTQAAPARAIPAAAVLSVVDLGADPTGTKDSTAAFREAIAAASASHAAVLVPSGVFRLNLTITASGTLIRGSGRGATRLQPWAPLAPVVQVGDGLQDVHDVSLTDFSVEPGPLGAEAAIGIRVLGARAVTLRSFSIREFGGDNIRLESSATRSTYKVTLHDFTSERARRSCLTIDASARWMTLIDLSAFHLAGHESRAARSLIIRAAIVDATTGWIDVPPNETGIIELSGGAAAILDLHGVHVDGTSDQVAATIDDDLYVTNHFRGSFTFEGNVRKRNGTVIALGRDGHLHDSIDRMIRNPFVLGKIGFNDSDGEYLGRSVDESSPAVFLGGRKTGGARLELEGAGLRLPLTAAAPLQAAGGGAMWANGGELRYARAHWPAAPDDGVTLTPRRAVANVALSGIPANDCAADVAIELPGASAGAECAVGLPPDAPRGLLATCFVARQSTVYLRLCNGTSRRLAAPLRPYGVRAWNP